MKGIELLKESGYSCVMIQKGVVVAVLKGIGVKPLISSYTRYPEMMQGAEIADKVIGKAAAMICTAGGAVSVHGEVMSQSGYDYLASKGIPCSYGELVPMILNRRKDGSCPIEASVQAFDDPIQGIQEIRKTIAILMAAGALTRLAGAPAGL